MIYSYLGGGIFHTTLAFQKWRSAETRASSIPSPGVASGLTVSVAPTPGAAVQAAPLAPSKGRIGAIIPALAALLCVGYCSSQNLSNTTGCAGPATTRGKSNEASLMAGRDTNAHTPARAPTLVPVAAPTQTPSPNAVPAPAPTTIAPAAATTPVAELLGRYYADLNSNQFEANRYFEPQVERYITMMNTSTGAMNQYIRNVFPKQFQQYTFSLEPGSLVATAPSQYDYVERSEYFLVAKKKTLRQRVMVRITVSNAGKMTFLHQYKRLPWEELKTPPV